MIFQVFNVQYFIPSRTRILYSRLISKEFSRLTNRHNLKFRINIYKYRHYLFIQPKVLKLTFNFDVIYLLNILILSAYIKSTVKFKITQLMAILASFKTKKKKILAPKIQNIELQLKLIQYKKQLNLLVCTIKK